MTPSDPHVPNRPPRPTPSGSRREDILPSELPPTGPMTGAAEVHISEQVTVPEAPTSIADPHSEDSWVGYVVADRYVLKSIVGEG
ncbi:MAG: hypothetical protein VB934_10710, partial [Polyangiaceae bacterium]